MAWALRDPAQSGMSVEPIDVEWADVESTRPRDQGRFDVLGASRSTFVNGPLRGREWQGLPFLVRDQQTYDRVMALVESGRTLQLADDLGASWWVQVTGVAVTEYATQGRDVLPLRRIRLSLVEVGAP